jgi:hypothetical protein
MVEMANFSGIMNTKPDNKRKTYGFKDQKMHLWEIYAKGSLPVMRFPDQILTTGTILS